MNDINFYNMMAIDQLKAKKKNNTDFKSCYVLSDMALIRGTKFY